MNYLNNILFIFDILKKCYLFIKVLKEKMSNNKLDKIFDEFLESNKNINQFSKLLAESPDGEIREVKYNNNKQYVAKLIRLNEKKYFYPEKLRGPNIIKIIEVIDKEINGINYQLIIMEKAYLRDLSLMSSHIHKFHFLKIINKPFVDFIGDNFMRFFIKQVVHGLEILERNELVHFDLKPDNMLITRNLKLKISDFSFLINLNEAKGEIIIPERTEGYLSPEFYKVKDKDKIDAKTAKKQDYFALGSSIFLLKTGEQMLKYPKSQDEKMMESRIIDLLQRDIAHIRSYPLMDKGFADFLCSLIHYTPEERPNFEEIYRNKWLNENEKDISLVANSFTDEEENKLMIELLKSDFLIEKRKIVKVTKKKRYNFNFSINKINKNK